ncbi:OsmC-like protein [compost metagenome]
MIAIRWNGSSYKTTSDYTYEPPDGAALSPMDIMCEALGMCIAVSLVRLLEQEEIEENELIIEVQPHKASVGAPRVEKFRITADFARSLDSDLREKLLTHASRICTIGNTLKRGAELTYELKN